MKVAGYVCDFCPEGGQDIPNDDIRDEYLCPTCGKKMWYLCSYEVDEKTGLTIGDNWQDPRRIKPANNCNTNYNTNSKPTITCPYCQSTNTKKLDFIDRGISFGFFGFGSGKLGKQWKCNACKSCF